MSRHPRARIVAIALVGLAPVALPCPAQDAKPSAPSAKSRAMGELAATVRVADPDSGKTAELIGEPVYRFDDPAGGFANGTVWAFGKAGRPAALLVLSLELAGPGKLRWLEEVVSLADGPLSATGGSDPDPWAWKPGRAGVALKPLPDTPAPAADEARRLRQMREAARRFGVPDRRLLPHPIHCYKDPAAGLVDGAVFLSASGGNPELALLIEARRGPQADPTWSYALARITAAPLRVSLDGRDVADLPGLAHFDPSEPYFLILRPAPNLTAD